MKKNNLQTVLLCGLVAMIVTIVFYLLTFDNIFTIPMRWFSLLCLLLVEVLGTVKALRVRRSIWGGVIGFVGLIHLGAVLVLSLVFVNALPLLLKQYLLLNVLLLAIVALIDILLVHFGRRARESNQQYMDSASVIDECLMKARQLLLETDSSDYKQQIGKIVESLQYSNRSALSGNEDEIITELDELHDMIKSDDADAVAKIVKKIQNMLNLRTAQLKKTAAFNNSRRRKKK